MVALAVAIAIGLRAGMDGLAGSLAVLVYDAFGLTMLRLYSLTVAWWLGAVFVLVGIALAGFGRTRHWLLGAVAASMLLAAQVLNLLDPEAYVVDHNSRRASGDLTAQTIGFDAGYTATLSDDAVPALYAALPSLGSEQHNIVLGHICGREPRPGRPVGQPGPRPVLAWNRSASEAQRIREEAC